MTSSSYCRNPESSEADDRERGSLPFLMLVMVLSAAIGAVFLTTVMQQTRTAAFDETRVRSLAAAQGGLDQALTQIRGAVNVSNPTSGDASRLPCFRAPNDVIDVDGSGLTTARIEVAYYRTSPRTLTDAQLQSKKMLCSDNEGPYDPTELSRSPRYALISATGVDGSRSGPGVSRGRKVQATYDFQTSDAVASAGQIRIYPTSSSTVPMCMDAGSNPYSDPRITLQRCSEAKPAQQMFSYRPDLSIQLVRQPNAAANAPLLCIDTSNSTSHFAGNQVVLKSCSAQVVTSSVRSAWYQLWSVNDWGQLEGSLSNKSNIDGWCIDVASQVAGTTLSLQGGSAGCSRNTIDPRKVWVPSPTTGAGAAGPANQQIVNYQQFATCIDVTNASATWEFLILYTCKQNPSSSNVKWNQRFVMTQVTGRAPTTTLIKVRDAENGNTEYCLQNQANSRPRLINPCPSSPTGAFAWRVSQRYQTAAADSPELPYSDRYTIKASNGQCLTPGPNSDIYKAYYKLAVAPCDGTTLQKWNADPSSLAGSVGDYRELTVPTS